MVMAIWLILLIPFLVLVVVRGKRRASEDEDYDEEVGSGTYLGEEGEEEEVEVEMEEDDGGKLTKEEQTPLWKYVTKIVQVSGGGAIKFTCSHCNITFTGSYTRVRYHLCGEMPWDRRVGGKGPGIRACAKVSSKERAQYRKEEEEAQYKFKRLRAEQEATSSRKSFGFRSDGSTHGSGASPMQLSRRTLSDFLDQGCRDDVDAKVFRFLYANGVPFNVLRSPYWHEMVDAFLGAPKGYKSPGYDKARTVGLDTEKGKIKNALGQFTNSWNEYGVSIVSDGWTNVKGKPLINILGVSASGAVFLSSHDYSDRFKTGINIAEPILNTIESIGPYNVIQVITDNAANCKAAGAIIEDKYPNIFWSGCLVHTMNLLMHDIVKIKEPNYRWIGELYKRGKRLIRFITNHSNAHHVFRSHSKLELLKIGKTRFASYYLTFRRLLKVREALASMVSSESWQVLKDRATSTSDRHDFQEVEDTVLDVQFWASVKYVLQFTKPVYMMIRFADTDQPVIGEVYEQMDNMLGQIKDIVEPKDAVLYEHIRKHVVSRWDKLNVPLHALAYVLTPKYYSPSWLNKPAPGGGVRKKPHTDPEVHGGYMAAIDKLVQEEEEQAILRSELSKYLSQHGVFANLHANKDRDRMNPIEWWNMYGSSTTQLHKLAVRVLSQVVNSSSAERCWSTYNFIHSVKRNSLNENRAESLVYVHYNLRLLTRYCERAKNDLSKAYNNWDNNPEENNLVDGALALERLEAELLGDEDGDNAAATSAASAVRVPSAQRPLPSPTSSTVPGSLASQSPSMRGGHIAHGPGRIPRPVTVPPTHDEGAPSSIVHRSREKKLEVSRGKRKS